MEETTLLFRHLPAELSVDERRDMLYHFGASRVRVFGQSRKMKNTAFATFPSKEHASEVLHQLHQVEVLGSTLNVEFARNTSEIPSVVDDEGKPFKVQETAKKSEEKEETNLKAEEIKFDTTFKIWGLSHPRLPELKYLYPPPTAMVLTNIMNALASVPKFYVQVLHLMNKMDLPCPFGPLTAAPPLQPDVNSFVQQQPDDVDQREMDISSETESELESDGEEKLSRTNEEHQVKRLHRKSLKKRLKRPKLTDLQDDLSASATSTLPTMPVTEVFDQMPDSSSHPAKKIELKIPNAVASSHLKNRMVNKERIGESQSHRNLRPPSSIHPQCVENPEHRSQSYRQTVLFNEFRTPSHHQLPAPPPPPPLLYTDGNNSAQNGAESVPIMRELGDNNVDYNDEGTGEEPIKSGGFGIIKPIPKDSSKREDQEESSQKEWGRSKFVSSSELRKGRLSHSELRELSVFKKYEPGEPSCRLYIKNVAKQANEEDLHWLYGRYVDWDNETEQNIFDIRLMKEGRMKGQAFITLPSEEVATDALKDTNGFLLKDKPLVVQFARSAKAQEETPSGSNKSR